MGQREREVAAEDVEAAMGEIDDAHDAEDEREADADQRVLGAQAQTDQSGRYQAFHTGSSLRRSSIDEVTSAANQRLSRWLPNGRSPAPGTATRRFRSQGRRRGCWRRG